MAKENTDRLKRKAYTSVFYKNNKLPFFVTIVCTICGSVIQVYLARICQRYLDVTTSTNNKELYQLLMDSAVFLLFVLVTMLVERKVKFLFFKRAVSAYRDKAFVAITRKNIGAFRSDNTSNYISALTNDVTTIEGNYLNNSFEMIEMMSQFVIAFGMMLMYSWVMTLVVLVLCTLPILVSLIIGDKVSVQEKEISNKNAGFVSMVKDLLNGFSVIKSFKAEKEAVMLYSEKNNNLEAMKCKRQMTAAMISIITSITNITVQIGVFFVGAYLVMHGSMTAGIVFAFVQLMGASVLQPISRLSLLFANRKAAKALIDKMISYVEYTGVESGTEVLNEVGQGIIFQNVGFAYEEDNEVLKNINLNFEAGKSYAIVGGSGSGKSTLLDLIMGSHSNYTGSIQIDGKEMRNINHDTIFDVISVVQQNVFIFDDTILRNISMFKEFEPQQVEEAIQKAGLNKLLLSKGRDYLCGENGINLSGGERQRISIARSLLKHAKVLLVDEATAALDAQTSKNVVNSILAIDGLTKLVITHRMDEQELSQYDQIIVLQNGRVVEQGHFNDLVNQRRYFYSLYNVNKAVS